MHPLMVIVRMDIRGQGPGPGKALDRGPEDVKPCRGLIFVPINRGVFPKGLGASPIRLRPSKLLCPSSFWLNGFQSKSPHGPSPHGHQLRPSSPGDQP